MQFAHNLDRHLVALGCADDGGKAWHAAVHHLHSPCAGLHIAYRTVVFKAIAYFWLLSLDELDAFYQLRGEQRGQAGMNGVFKSWHVRLGFDAPQQTPGVFQRLLHVAKLLYLLPGKGVDHREIIGCSGSVAVDEFHGRILAVFGYSAFQHRVSFVYDFASAAYSQRGHKLRHHSSCEFRGLGV